MKTTLLSAKGFKELNQFKKYFAHSVGVVEYTNCVSAEGPPTHTKPVSWV